MAMRRQESELLLCGRWDPGRGRWCEERSPGGSGWKNMCRRGGLGEGGMEERAALPFLCADGDARGEGRRDVGPRFIQ